MGEGDLHAQRGKKDGPHYQMDGTDVRIERQLDADDAQNYLQPEEEGQRQGAAQSSCAEHGEGEYG